MAVTNRQAYLTVKCSNKRSLPIIEANNMFWHGHIIVTSGHKKLNPYPANVEKMVNS